MTFIIKQKEIGENHIEIRREKDSNLYAVIHSNSGTVIDRRDYVSKASANRRFNSLVNRNCQQIQRFYRRHGMIDLTYMNKRDSERVFNHLKKAAAIIDKYEENGAEYGTILFNSDIDLDSMASVVMTIDRVFNDSYE